MLLQQLALTGDVTAVALGQHVLAQGSDRFTRDDARTDSSLHGDFKLLAWNEFLEALRHLQPIGVGRISVDDGAERIDLFTVE